MKSESEVDDSDFKPFFDMIIGVLFILLILISAQMFFASAPERSSALDEKNKLSLKRDIQRKFFLEDFRDRLRAGGFQVELDLPARTLILDLAQFSSTSVGGVPQFSENRTKSFSREMSDRLACVFAVQSVGCVDTNLVQLGQVKVDVGGALPSSDSNLSRERFAELQSTLFTAAILSHQANLLALTGSGGMQLVQFSPSSESADTGGRVRMRFVFQE